MYNYCLFIDDDDAINFLHKMVVSKTPLALKTEFYNDPEEALNHLRSLSVSTLPEIIFLDINMPKINGWTLIDYFQEFGGKTPRFIMLSTSINPADRIQANDHPLVIDFMTKPLSKMDIATLLETKTHLLASKETI